MDLSRVFRKSAWKEKAGDVWSFYCPLCRAQRALPDRPEAGTPWHYLQIGLTAAVVALLAWPWFGWKGLVSFIPLWAIFEFVHRTRVRASVKCPQCGFDAYLCLVDVQRARVGVEAHWRKRFTDLGLPYPEKPGASPSRDATVPAEPDA